MKHKNISAEELQEIISYFGPIEDLDKESFNQKRNELRKKYHPDKFEHFDDETVKEMAHDKFKRLELLCGKVELLLDQQLRTSVADPADFDKEDATFAFDKMKIEIITGNKDLKYHLFGAKYRLLEFGESFNIPGTESKIITDESHQGVSVGFSESVKLYLSFGTSDNTDVLSNWLHSKIKDQATGLIIEGQSVAINLLAINAAIRRTAFVAIGSPAIK